jgi:GntP family gluconate:H+ symporter
MDFASLANHPGYLLGVACCAVVGLLLLIVYLRLHAFIALILISVLTAIFAGIPLAELLPTLKSGFGGTLASVALLVGLGAMIGKILEASGGAQVLADTLINRFGAQRAPLALGVASLLFGFPIFFDVGLVVLMPIILSVAYRFGGSLLVYALPAAGAFAVMHAFVPPHPGPVAAADFLQADIGLLLLVGLVIALPTWYFGAYLFGRYCAKKYHIKIDASLFSPTKNVVQNPPSFTLVFMVLLLPVLLISFNTVINTLLKGNIIEQQNALLSGLILIGQTPIALLITLLASLLIFSRQFSRQALQNLCEQSLGPICAVVLVTGAGGMFGGVLRASGIGDALATALTDTGLPIIVAAFVISTCLRVAQGSATVALTTTAALMSPVVAGATHLTSIDACLIVIAIAGGATVLSHFNDSGFWLVSRLLNMDEKTTLKTWTVMETLLGSIAFAIAATLSLFL